MARVDAGHLLLRAGGLPLRAYPCVETPRSRPEPSSPPSLPLDPVPSSASLPRTPPSGARRLRRRNHGHQPSLAHPACLRAPSRHLRPPHQAMELRTRHNVAGIAVSIAGRRGSSSSIHHHRRVPEPANHPYGTAVSSHASPPSFPLRLRPVASIPPEPRARLRRRCRRRRCRSPNSRPSTTSSSWISQEPAQPLSSLARQA